MGSGNGACLSGYRPAVLLARGHNGKTASLYRRFHQAGLAQVKTFPQLVTYTEQAHWQNIQDRVFSALNPEEAEEYHTAVAKAQAEGSFFIAEQFPCAVGVRP